MNSKQAKAILKALKTTATKPKNTKATALKFFTQKLGLKVAKDNFTVELPVKDGTKSFDAVKFDNGRTAVYCRGNSYLKYSWN